MAKKVLVVEDNLLNLKLFCDLLRVHGYDARAVSDGRLALGEAREFTPDLVIMDIQLPHVSGLELIGEAKRDPALQAIPIMAVTAYAAVGDEERIRAAGAEAYVSKPISVLRFAEEVRALIGAANEESPAPAKPEGSTEQEEPRVPAQAGTEHPEAASEEPPLASPGKAPIADDSTVTAQAGIRLPESGADQPLDAADDESPPPQADAGDGEQEDEATPLPLQGQAEEDGSRLPPG